jgi:hypothetical protein
MSLSERYMLGGLLLATTGAAWLWGPWALIAAGVFLFLVGGWDGGDDSEDDDADPA